MMTKFAIPELQKSKGYIVWPDQNLAKLGWRGILLTVEQKGFNHAFMKGVAVEQAKFGVRANCVCPGPIDTAWTRRSEGPMKCEDENNARCNAAGKKRHA